MMRDLLTEYQHAAEEKDHEARVRQQTESHKASAEHYRKMAHEHLAANSKYRRELSTERATSARMRAAVDGIADDYMTSDQHHPDFVLIPTTKFDQIRTALAAAKEAGR